MSLLTVKRGRDEQRVRWREWYDFYEVAAARVGGVISPSAVWPLLGPERAPAEVVIVALKVDSDLPPAQLAHLWIRVSFGGASEYAFPCTAFDREYAFYEVVRRPNAAGVEVEAVELAVRPPKFQLPLRKTPDDLLVVELYARAPLTLERQHDVVVTVMGATVRELDADPNPDPAPPHPKLGYCHFCADHPTHPRQVPAVTVTRGGLPRCLPCGRWVE